MLVCRSYAEIVTLKVWQSRVAACVHTCDYMYGYKISQVDAQEFNLESSHKILYKNPVPLFWEHIKIIEIYFEINSEESQKIFDIEFSFSEYK